MNKDHIDCVSLRTVTYLDNLSSCEQLKKLTHPLVFSPLIEDLDESHEVISLLEKDLLTDFTFHLQVENVNSVMYQMVFSVLGKLQHLKRLKVTQIAATCTTNIEILNNTLGRQSQIEDLEVNFTHDKDEPGSLTAIKFPKYLKKLKCLTLTNIWHKDFTETLFDMASQKRLNSLNL